MVRTTHLEFEWHNQHELTSLGIFFVGTDLNLAAPLDVGSFMKWGLARLINEKGGRGFLSWDLYNEFKVGEQGTFIGIRSLRVEKPLTF